MARTSRSASSSLASDSRGRTAKGSRGIPAHPEGTDVATCAAGVATLTEPRRRRCNAIPARDDGGFDFSLCCHSTPYQRPSSGLQRMVFSRRVRGVGIFSGAACLYRVFRLALSTEMFLRYFKFYRNLSLRAGVGDLAPLG